MLSDIPVETDPRVLVDFRTADDAGVYAWEAGPALVQTVDFFTPIVDDPYVYGEIAAANSLSDVYAMGGRPLTALAIAGFPEDLVDAATIAQVFRGGHDTLRRAGVVLLGGHTVRDREIKFGYAVTGAVDPDRIWTQRRRPARRRPDPDQADRHRHRRHGHQVRPGARSALVERAVAGMRTLNRAAAEALATRGRSRLHRCDRLRAGRPRHRDGAARAAWAWRSMRRPVPLIEGVMDLVAQNKAGGLATNRSHFGERCRPARQRAAVVADLLFDPQTSGGLLVAVPGGGGRSGPESTGAAGVVAARIGLVSAPTAAI